MRRFVIHFLFVASVILLPVCIAQAQDYPKVNIVSPNATAMAKYVDFPVSYHTGVPQINIPIYTVQEGPLQMPISLSYHASGLKVMEPASWVGAGWSLNVGGVVSRTVRGNPDEKKGANNDSFLRDNGYSNYYLRPGDIVNDYAAFARGWKDGQPDLYTYNVGGYSGKFYFREDQTPKFIPEADLKVEPIFNTDPNLSNNYDYLQGFTITDPDGIKYHFGMTPDDTTDVDAIEKSMMSGPETYPQFPSVISSWHLYRVESADGQFHIDLSYRREEYGYFTVTTNPCMPNSTCEWQIAPGYLMTYGLAPEKIEFSNGFVEFIPGNLREDLGRYMMGSNDLATDEAKRLGSIKVQSAHSTHCKTYNFSYGYFHDLFTPDLPYAITQWAPNLHTDRKRLKLNSIQESSCDGSDINPPFVFQYYDEDKVPRRMSFAQDHWGFYNGLTSNSTLQQSYSVNNGQSFYPGDNRDPQWPAMRAGALHMIQYPTGGGNEFIYEPNMASVSDNCTASSPIHTITAGMGSYAEGFGVPYNFDVTTPTVYFYRLASIGSSTENIPGSGKLLLGNNPIAVVDENQLIREGYILLQPGSYSFIAYANSDDAMGVGTQATIHIATCSTPSEKMVGGLRIRQINKFGTNQSPKMFARYEYRLPYLYSIPAYVSKLRNEVLRTLVMDYGTEEGCRVMSETNTNMWYFTSPSAIHPLQEVQGYHIGYGNVKEILPDSSYTVYQYRGMNILPSHWLTLEDVCVRKIDISYCSPNDPVFPAPPLPYDFERGNLISKEIFDKNNNKIQESIYSQQYIEDQVGSFGLIARFYPDNDGAPYLVSHYNLKTKRLRESKEVQRTFDENGNTIENENITYYNSQYHNLPSKKLQTWQASSSTTELLYVPDLTKCNTGCADSITRNYVDSAALLLERYTILHNRCRADSCNVEDFIGWLPLEFYYRADNDLYADNPCLSVDGDNNYLGFYNCRKGAYIDYQYRMNQLRVTYTKKILECKEANQGCIPTGLTSTNDAVKALFRLEDSNQLKLLESIHWRDTIFQSASYLDYRSNASPDNHVYLRNVYTTEVASPVYSFNPAKIQSNSIQRDSKYSTHPLMSYVFDQGQPVQITGRDGVQTSYVWEYNNTVPKVKGVNVSATALKSAFTTSESNMRTNLPNAQITTYKNDPVFGVEEIIDANGRRLQYEYDKLGRLIRIKDHDGNILEQYEYNYQVN